MTETSSPPILTRVDQGIHYITFDSQHNRNALSHALVTATHAALDEAEAGGRVVVLGAKGPAFCAGADMRQRTNLDDATPPPPDLFERLVRYPIPVIAVVNGAVRAGGLGLVAAADIAIGTENASFGVTEVHRGLIPAVISVVCRDIMDRRRMQRYFLTGEPFGADDAVRAGLLTEAVNSADLDDSIAQLTDWFLKGAPNAIRLTKELLSEVDTAWEARMVDMRSRSKAAFEGPDGQEGMRAFLEKRAPAWQR